MNWAIEQAGRLGLPKVVYLNIDDSLGEKDKHTHSIEPVAWFHDHNESTPQRPRYKNAFCYLECTLKVGDVVLTLDLRLYLPDSWLSDKARLDKAGVPEEERRSLTKPEIALDLLDRVRAEGLPGCQPGSGSMQSI